MRWLEMPFRRAFEFFFRTREDMEGVKRAASSGRLAGMRGASHAVAFWVSPVAASRPSRGPAAMLVAAAATARACRPRARWPARGFLSGVLPELPAKTITHAERRVVRFTPEQVFAVVSNVEDYPLFIPWCRAARTVSAPAPALGTCRGGEGSRTELGGVGRAESLSAELEVGFQGLSEKYVSCVELRQPHSIVVAAQDSTVFRELTSSWEFQPGPSPGSCWVHFRIEFAFRNPVYGQLAAGFTQEVAATMVGAFEQRCQQMYST